VILYEKWCYLQIAEEKRWLRQLTPAFVYRPHANLTSATYTSKTSLDMYDGGGYAHDFDIKDAASFDNITSLLQDFGWVDAATRLVVVEMTLYSPPTDLITTAFFMVRRAAAPPFDCRRRGAFKHHFSYPITD
jgi:hypothetical protein